MSSHPRRLSFVIAWAICCTFSAWAHFEENDPPKNPYLADSPWPMTHRNPYCQASTFLPGPSAAEMKSKAFQVRTVPEQAVAITLNFSPRNESGNFSIWGSSLSTLYKLNSNQNKWRSATSVRKSGKSSQAISGAYTLLDAEGFLYVPRDRKILVYQEDQMGEPKSRIRKVRQFEVPFHQFKYSDELIIGMNLTYDGYLAMVTNYSLVCVMDRKTGKAVFYRIGDQDEVSNSLAVDEEGGIYIVTHKRMVRLNWDGKTISKAWESAYPTNDLVMPGRLGRGSGTTPTLMGVGSQDKLVVIASGEEKMQILAFWRNEIPKNWTGLPGYSPRVAGVAPILFGDPQKKRSITDQSLLVRGYDVVAVNNDYGERASDNWTNFWTILWSNYKDYAPYGIEKFHWDPQARKLKSVWGNPRLSVPNGIPAMSEASGLMYYVGQHNEKWTLEGVSWESGELDFRIELENAIKFNSYYAGMEIGYDKMLVNGTVGGAIRLAPRYP